MTVTIAAAGRCVAQRDIGGGGDLTAVEGELLCVTLMR